MADSILNWQAHEQPDFDAKMDADCSQLLANLKKDASLRRSILADVRSTHHHLYEPFTPEGHPDFAGTYRGTPGSTVEHRRITAPSQVDPSKHLPFFPPDSVALGMEKIYAAIQNVLSSTTTSNYLKLYGLAYAVCLFGRVHPFMDGNGHMQRVLFAACAIELGFELSPRFVIHPRPYGSLFSIAAEYFTLAASPEKMEDEAILATEYLAFFLEAPFNVPRANIPV